MVLTGQPRRWAWRTGELRKLVSDYRVNKDIGEV